MSAQQAELLFVATVDIALGCVLVFTDPERLPDPVRKIALRLGRYRKRIGATAIVVGAALAIASLAGAA